MNTPALQRAVFLLLLAGVTLAFFWIIAPFFGAVFWAVVLTLLFMPLFRRLRARLRGRDTLAAVATLLICLLIVVVPLAFIIGAMADEAASFTQRVRSGELNLPAYFQQVVDALPTWLHGLLSRFGLLSMQDVGAKLSAALVQGLLGGLAFAVLGIHGAVLWGVTMAVLSLVPAVGAALIWAPVAIYLLATGSPGAGIGLAAWGMGVMGMVDNLLRPLLVGKETKLPDFLVLLSTIGGISVFGVNGFVIGPAIAALFVAAWALFSVAENDASEATPPPSVPPEA